MLQLPPLSLFFQFLSCLALGFSWAGSLLGDSVAQVAANDRLSLVCPGSDLCRLSIEMSTTDDINRSRDASG